MLERCHEAIQEGAINTIVENHSQPHHNMPQTIGRSLGINKIRILYQCHATVSFHRHSGLNMNYND
jgi:hypothetical protein